MVKTQVGEGKTVERAIEEALNKLQVSRDEVVVEILQEPTTGIFGLGGEGAVVRLTVKQEQSSSPSRLALVSVVAGQLEYTLPTPHGGVPASLHFGSEFQVRYQGEVVSKSVTLTQGLETLEIVLPQDTKASLNYEFVVNRSKTKAELLWKHTPGVIYSLADKAPTNRLHLRLQKKLVDPEQLSLAKAKILIASEGFKHGLTIAELTDETFKSARGIVTVAVGREPIPPEAPAISYVFQNKEPSVDLDAVRIDYYEVHGTQGVEVGDVLAIKKPGHPGTPGIDIYGNTIPITPLRDVHITTGDGVSLSTDGLQATATVSGIPSLQAGVLKVNRVFELPGDADISTGNITVNADIIIRGNVLESVKVESESGLIVVNGLVSGALLRSGGSITVLRNVVRSQLFAGGATVTQIRLLSMLHQISDQLEGLIVAYETIVAQADNIPFDNLVKHLIELKFYNLPKHVKEFSDFVQKMNSNTQGDLGELEEVLSSCILNTGPLRISDIDMLRQIYARVREQALHLENLTRTTADIKVGYLQNSRLEASGQVEITGQGCFYSTVLAGTGIKLANGVFRGGEVVLNEGTIMVKELGGPTGIVTNAQIIKTGRILANRVHPNVSVSIGTQSYKFGEMYDQVKVYLEGGNLTVYSGVNKIHS